MGIFGFLARVLRAQKLAAMVTAVALVAALTTWAGSPGAAEPLSDSSEGVLGREPIITPEEQGEGFVDGLQYADPTEGLALVAPPIADASGSALVGYPLLVPPGRGITPELAISYDSSGGNGWVGVGWDLSVGEISVDTRWGAPRFSPTLESETYLIDGDVLLPNALGATWAPRLAGDRQDFTRQVETEFEQIIRHEVAPGGPANYYWEVHDKEGNVRWYGGHPDRGGPDGDPLLDAANQPLTIDRNAIITDDNGNAVRWLLSAERDVGVNMIRYHYETIEYANGATTWVEQPPIPTGELAWMTPCAPAPGKLCARHTYLSRIDYTAAAAASGEPEDPAYQMHFIRESELSPAPVRRSDSILDGIGGHLDLILDRLARVEVRTGPRQADNTRTYDQLAVRYNLQYENGPFGKTLLSRVTQVGSDGTTSAAHDFAYNDRVINDAGTYNGFGVETAWQPGNDGLDKSYGFGPAPAGVLGASENNAGNFSIYLGFNPSNPSKTGSFGGSLALGGSGTDGIVEWLDLNGDLLPDKVYRSGGSVWYRLNRSGPDGTTTEFGSPTRVVGINSLSSSGDFSIMGSFEAHFGVTAAFGLGASAAWSPKYFADVNSDGLPDYVSDGNVFFNHLSPAGVPTFTVRSTDTDVPILSGTAGPISVAEVDAIEAQLSDDNPLVDSIRRWTAPFTGTVSVIAPVTLTPPAAPDGSPYSGDGVRVALQHNEAELINATLAGAGAAAFASPTSLSVTAGDRIYFRVGSIDDGARDQVSWDPQITYTAIDGYTDVADVPLDANGSSQITFRASDDFTLAGRPDTVVFMPEAGTVQLDASVSKRAVTTDDLQVVVLLNGAPVAGSGQTIAADFVGDTPVSLSFDVSDPTPPPAGDEVSGPTYDRVTAYLAVDSPIDVTAVEWDPELTYVGSPELNFAMVPEIENYSLRSSPSPMVPWTATDTKRYDGSLSLTRQPGSPAGQAVVSVKSNGELVAQTTVTVPANTGIVPSATTVSVDLDADLDKDSEYWFDVTIREQALAYRVTFNDFSLVEATDNATTATSVPATLHSKGQQGFFPNPYRGWAAAGYNANDGLATIALDENAFVIDTSGLPTEATLVDAPTGWTDTEFEQNAPIQDTAYAYTPARILSDPNDDGSPKIPVWRGSRENVRVAAGHAAASRLGGDSAEVPGAGGGAGRAVTRIGITGPQVSASLGVFGFGGSFGLAPSFGLVGYEDLNGDSFPDIVTPNSVIYTNPRGGYLPAAAPPNAKLDQVNRDLTFTVAGGFGGDLLKSVGNAFGRTNANTGQAAPKGGSDTGPNLGFSLGVNASWTSPNAGDPLNTCVVCTGPEAPTTNVSAPVTQATNEGVYNQNVDDGVQKLLTDVNGDGLADRVFVKDSGVYVNYNLGYSFAAEAIKLSGGAFEAVESFSGSFGIAPGFSFPDGSFGGGVSYDFGVDLARTTWSDVNGDGIIDRLRKVDGQQPRVAFGTGSGLLTEVVYGTVFDGEPVVGVATGPQIVLDRSASLGGGLSFTIGFPVVPIVPCCYLIINPGFDFQQTRSSSQVDLQDVNGDGYLDSVKSTGDGDLSVRANLHGDTNLLSRVTNPLGGTIDLQYTRGGNTTAHPDTLWTMSRVDVNDGRPGDGVDIYTTTYDYEGARFDKLHRESLGHSRIIEKEVGANDVPLRITNRSFLNGNVFEAGLETGFTITDTVGNKLQDSSAVWQFIDVVTGLSADFDAVPANPEQPISLGLSVSPQMSQANERWFTPSGDVGQELQMEMTYDRLGNPLTQIDRGELEDPDDDLVATYTYSTCDISASPELVDVSSGGFGCGTTGPNAVDPLRYGPTSPFWTPTLCNTWVSLPAQVTLTNGKSGDDEIVFRKRDGRTAICDNASVTHLEETIGGTEVAVTDLNYDEWGSYDRIVYPESEDGTRYAVRYEWDDDSHGNISVVKEYQLDAAAVTAFIDTGAEPSADQIGLTSTALFDPLSGRVSSRRDANNNVTTYTYDAFGRIASISSPAAADTVPLVRYEYSPTASGYAYAVAKHYDRFNPGNTIDTITFVDGLGRVTQTKRDATISQGGGQPAVDQMTVSGAEVYDSLGRVVQEFNPKTAPLSQQTTFFTGGQTGPFTTTAWDLYDQATRIDEPGGRLTTIAYEYGAFEQDGSQLFRTTTTDARLRQNITYTDVRGMSHALENKPSNALPQQTRFVHDAMGQLLTVIDTAGNVTTHQYDMLGRRLSTDTPDGGLIEFGYDDEGKLISEVSPTLRAAAQVTRYAYEFGRLVGIDHPDGTPDVSYVIGGPGAPNNGAGRVIQSEDGSRISTNHYNAAGQLTQQTAEMKLHRWYNVTNKSEFRWTTQWSYDGLARIESLTFPDSEVLTYDYDSGGMVKQIEGDKWGTKTVVIGQDPLGNDITEEQPFLWEYDYLNDRQYDEFIRPAFQELGNGATTDWDFDVATQWLTDIVTISPNRNTDLAAQKEIQDIHYTYDLVGNPLTYANDLPAKLPSLMGGPAQHAWAYDPYGRLESASGRWEEADGKLHRYTWAVAYDVHGNVISKDQSHDIFNGKKGLIQTETTYSFDRTYNEPAPHQATSVGLDTYHYDADGNFLGIKDRRDKWIRQVTWDGAGHMRTVTDGPSTTDYTYDDTGQRTIERGPAGETAFINPWVTIRNENEMWKHIWAGDERVAVKRRDRGGDEELKRYFLHKDLQGSTNVVTDYRGDTFQRHEYFATGELFVDEKSTVFRTPFQYGGGYVDEVREIIGFGQRWHDPSREMMYSPDPILVDDPEAVITQPGLRAAYAFAGANPVSYVDPTGWRYTSAQAKLVRTQLASDPGTRNLVRQQLEARLPNSLVRLSLDIKEADLRQERAEKRELQPLFELDFDKGTFKFGLIKGKRYKTFLPSRSAAAADQTDPQSTDPRPQPIATVTGGDEGATTRNLRQAGFIGIESGTGVDDDVGDLADNLRRNQRVPINDAVGPPDTNSGN